jgi:hypothetical protein
MMSARCVRALRRRRERQGEAGGRRQRAARLHRVGVPLTGDTAVLPAFDTTR